MIAINMVSLFPYPIVMNEENKVNTNLIIVM
jgi:hypothetical protein